MGWVGFFAFIVVASIVIGLAWSNYKRPICPLCGHNLHTKRCSRDRLKCSVHGTLNIPRKIRKGDRAADP